MFVRSKKQERYVTMIMGTKAKSNFMSSFFSFFGSNTMSSTLPRSDSLTSSSPGFRSSTFSVSAMMCSVRSCSWGA